MKVGNRIVQDVMLLNNKKMVRYFESLIIGSLFVYLKKRNEKEGESE